MPPGADLEFQAKGSFVAQLCGIEGEYCIGSKDVKGLMAHDGSRPCFTLAQPACPGDAAVDQVLE